jgi:hypothetical protein
MSAARAEEVQATSSESQQPEVVVTATVQVTCEGNSLEDLRRLAHEAEQSGAHQRAAECYRAAGDHARANRAMLRVAENSAAASKRNASVAASSAKAQMKRIREALR